MGPNFKPKISSKTPLFLGLFLTEFLLTEWGVNSPFNERFVVENLAESCQRKEGYNGRFLKLPQSMLLCYFAWHYFVNLSLRYFLGQILAGVRIHTYTVCLFLSEGSTRISYIVWFSLHLFISKSEDDLKAEMPAATTYLHRRPILGGNIINVARLQCCRRNIANVDGWIASNFSWSCSIFWPPWKMKVCETG